MTFKASLDKTAIIGTVLITLFFTVFVCWQLALIKEIGTAVPAYAATTCILIYFLAFIFRPVKYVLTTEELIIRRPAWDVRISRADIVSAERLEKKQISCSLRTFGVGGLFGYFGSFANFSLGAMTWYVTRRDKPVLLRTRQGKKIIISPDEPERLVSALQQGSQVF